MQEMKCQSLSEPKHKADTMGNQLPITRGKAAGISIPESADLCVGFSPCLSDVFGLLPPETIFQLLLTNNDRLFFFISEEKKFFSGAGVRVQRKTFERW